MGFSTILWTRLSIMCIEVTKRGGLPFNAHLPGGNLIIEDLGNRAMISDIEEFRAREETWGCSAIYLRIVSSRAPSLKRAVNGASVLKGWTPVNRINRGSRGTWWSGVSRSMLRTLVGALDGGGRGISGSSGTNISCVVAMGDFKE
jgi:hypothetical protein